ncbi:hypothetical protein PFISCL1PPCAC_13305, partial [Pristionchus fissidentatus]
FACLGAISSLFMMSFERQTATVEFWNYEQTSKYYGYKLAGAHILIASMFSLSFFLTFHFEFPLVVYCSITTPRGETVNQIAALLLTIMETWTIVMFMRMLRMNRARLEADNSFTLSERYQISENIR